MRSLCTHLAVLVLGLTAALGGCTRAAPPTTPAATPPAASPPAAPPVAATPPTPAAEVVADDPDDDCTRSNAATGDPHVKPGADNYKLERRVKARELVETFTHQGHSVTSTLGGCAHAGHTIRIDGPGVKTAAATAALLKSMPMETSSFVEALSGKPGDCGPAGEDGTTIISCDEFLQIGVRYAPDSVTVMSDFAM